MDNLIKKTTFVVTMVLILHTGIAVAEPQDEATTAAPAKAAPTAAAPAKTAENETAAPEPETADAQAEPEAGPEAQAEVAVAAAPQQAAEEEAPATKPTAGYDGGFFIQSGDGAFKLKIGARIKTLYSFVSTDNGGDADRTNTNAFSVPYARLYFSGHLFDKKLTYLFNPGFGGGNMKLVLAYADYAFIDNILHLTFGQLKRPFSRNYLTSSGKRAFINGPTGQFGNGVDIGLQLSNNFTKVKGLEWAIGLFNSQSATKPTFSGGEVIEAEDETQSVSGGKFSNVIEDFHPALALRVGYNNGIKGYHPTDFEGGGPRFGVALSAHTDFNANESDNGKAYLSTDMILKLYGFSLSGGVYLGWAGEETDEGASQFVWEDPTFDKIGAFAQAQMLIAKRFEPVLRWGLDNPDGDDNNKQEITAGFTVYIFGQNFKWENNFSTFLLQENDGVTHLQFLSQLQFLL